MFKVTSSLKTPYGKVLENGKPLKFTLQGSIHSKVYENEFGKSILFVPHDPDELKKFTDKLAKLVEVLPEEYNGDLYTDQPLLKEDASGIFFKVRSTIPNNDIGLTAEATTLVHVDDVTVDFFIHHYLNQTRKEQGFYLVLVSAVHNKKSEATPRKRSKQ